MNSKTKIRLLDALALYDLLDEVEREGGKIIVRHADGEEEELKVTGPIEHARRAVSTLFDPPEIPKQ